MDKVLLARQRKGDYVVNYDNKKYVWQGIKGNLVTKKEVPMEVFDFLQSGTACFQNGELVLMAKDNKEESKEALNELKENIPYVDEYEANTHSKEEIIALITGNVNKMKAELNKITSKSEKRFVMEIAKELYVGGELDSSAKQKFLVETFIGSKLSVEDYFEI